MRHFLKLDFFIENRAAKDHQEFLVGDAPTTPDGFNSLLNSPIIPAATASQIREQGVGYIKADALTPELISAIHIFTGVKVQPEHSLSFCMCHWQQPEDGAAEWLDAWFGMRSVSRFLAGD